MSWTDIHVDDYGWIGKLALTQDGEVVDISGYDTLQMIFINPIGVAITQVAELDTDGTDGVLKYTVADGDINATGTWKVFARVANGSAEITSNFVSFSVYARGDD